MAKSVISSTFIKPYNYDENNDTEFKKKNLVLHIHNEGTNCAIDACIFKKNSQQRTFYTEYTRRYNGVTTVHVKITVQQQFYSGANCRNIFHTRSIYKGALAMYLGNDNDTEFERRKLQST